MKNIIVLTTWKDSEILNRLKMNVESSIQGDFTYTYIIEVAKKEDLEKIPGGNGVLAYSKKDFSIFGKLKNDNIKNLLRKRDDGFLLVASSEGKLFKNILKASSLISLGQVSENKLPLTITFSDETGGAGSKNLFQSMNEYINKIKI